MEADTKAFRKEIRADTKAFREEIQADTKAFKEETNTTLSRMEADTKAFRKEIRADTKAFREEIQADTKAFKEEMRISGKRADRKWGDLVNKMGTLVEDMVAPNIPGVAEEYFGDGDLSFFAVRIQKRKTDDRNVRREFDVVAVSDRRFFICEVKSRPRPEDVRDFVGMLDEIPEYFPESLDRETVPVFASMYIPEDMGRHLTRQGIYAMAMRGDTMGLLNFEELRERGQALGVSG